MLCYRSFKEIKKPPTPAIKNIIGIMVIGNPLLKREGKTKITNSCNPYKVKQHSETCGTRDFKFKASKSQPLDSVALKRRHD